ncbi:MAG: hypothetical protein SH817_18260 [Leptospira sp.]|nr:hypothetical protein [Leptospira sp.]
MYFKLLKIFIFLILLVNCVQNRDEIYYHAGEANSKIFQAFAIKDASCGKSHIITTILLGRVKISDLNRCVKAIEIATCEQWQADNPTPEICKTINYIFK